MDIIKMEKYAALESNLKRRYDGMTSIINEINSIIPIVEDSCKTDGDNAYVNELRSIRDDIISKRDKIYNLIIPELEREIEQAGQS